MCFAAAVAALDLAASTADWNLFCHAGRCWDGGADEESRFAVDDELLDVEAVAEFTMDPMAR